MIALDEDFLIGSIPPIIPLGTGGRPWRLRPPGGVPDRPWHARHSGQQHDGRALESHCRRTQLPGRCGDGGCRGRVPVVAATGARPLTGVLRRGRREPVKNENAPLRHQ